MGKTEAALTFAYRVRVNRRARRVRIAIGPDGEVEVLLPAPESERTVRQLLVRHQDWIHARLADWRQQQAQLPAAQGLRPDAVHLEALSESWPITYGVGLPRGRWRQVETPRGLQLRAGADDPDARDGLRDWLHVRARQLLPPWLEQWARRLGLEVSGVSIRAQKTRWGSCSSLGRINLNRNLLFLPADLVDYLLVHELCHLREANHSPRYWQLVESILPDYRQRDRALREATALVPLWARSSS